MLASMFNAPTLPAHPTRAHPHAAPLARPVAEAAATDVRAPALPYPVRDEADMAMGRQAFGIMRVKHTPPGQLSVPMLRACLGVAQWEAQALYHHLTASHKPSAWPQARCFDATRMHADLPACLRAYSSRVSVLLGILGDHQQARTALHAQLQHTRRQLSDARRASRAANGSETTCLPDAIRNKQAELLAQSAQVYAFPFAGDALACASRRGAHLHTRATP